ncbi:MAG: helix-turn-helix domain-containing protein [Candidatus Micrarchaeota archaeon]
MNEGNAVRLLIRFGLTEYEAKTLSTLFKLNQAQAPEISRLAEVPKTRVYDVLEKLVQKKLVMEVNGRPKKYMVVELDNALNQLVESKKNELSELENSTLELKNTFANSSGTQDEDTGEKVLKVKDKNDFLKILSQEVEKAKKEVIGFTKLNHQHSLFRQIIKNAGDKKINVRLLTHSPANLESIFKDGDKNYLQTKTAKHNLTAFVIDNKRVILALSDLEKDKPDYHFSIWPSNPHLANAFTVYFDKVWNESK